MVEMTVRGRGDGRVMLAAGLLDPDLLHHLATRARALCFGRRAWRVCGRAVNNAFGGVLMRLAS